MVLQHFIRPWPLFQFLDQSVGLLLRGISPSQGIYLYIEQHKHRINADIHHLYLQVGFEPTTPVFERAKIVHALNSVATVIGMKLLNNKILLYRKIISDCTKTYSFCVKHFDRSNG
jgi:predicted HAD superfamily hydrolase